MLQQGRVQLPVLVHALLARRQRIARRLHGAGAEDGKFLDDDLQIRIGLFQLDHVRQRALAEAAVVVEELHHGDLALGIADDEIATGAEQGIRMRADHRLFLRPFRRLLALLQLVHHLGENFGMIEQIAADDLLDLFLLRRGEFRRQGHAGKQGKAGKGGNDRAQGAFGHHDANTPVRCCCNSPCSGNAMSWCSITGVFLPSSKCR